MSIEAIGAQELGQQNDVWAEMEAKTSTRKKEMDSTGFLQLLTVSMANQNPFDENSGNMTEAITQMATMSSVGKVHETMSAFANMTKEKMSEAASANLGKDVTIMQGKEQIEGRVTEVVRDAKDKMFVKLDGEDKEYDLADIVKVRLPKEQMSTDA